MRLLFTDDTFSLNGASFLGIPFLIDQDCELVHVANDYLLYVAMVRGSTRSPKTWRNHGEALFDYFAWLEANHRQWNDSPKSLATSQLISPLALYRNWSMSLLDDSTGRRRLKNSTINQRLACLLGFYRWCRSRDLIGEVPWDAQTRRVPEAGNTSFLRHAIGTRYNQQDDVRLKVFKDPPKLLTLEQCRLLVRSCKSSTLRLITTLILQAGLRNEECRSFPLRYVFNPVGLPPDKRIKVDLSPNDMALKNGKPRTVFITWQLMQMLHGYAQFGEAVIRHNAYKKEHGSRAQELFLNKLGMPYSEKALNNAYRQLWTGSGRSTLSFRVTPHMLRHTFATLELHHQNQRMPLAQALCWVRDRLGHTSLQTTSIYLHCLDLMDDADLNAYQQQLDQMMRTGEN